MRVTGLGRIDPSVRDGLYARAKRRAIPLHVVWELTKRCNLKCYQCYVSAPDTELSTARSLALISELADAGCMGVTLTGGEVGLRSDLLPLAREIRRQRMLLTVFTNGTVLGARDLKALAQIGPSSVAVSLYGPGAEAHDSVTGVAGSFERTVETLRQLHSLRVRCRVHGVLVRETADELEAIANLAESLGCEWRFDPSVTPAQDGSLDVLDHRVPIEQLGPLLALPRLAERTKEHAASHGAEREPGHPIGNCGAGLVTAYISAAGDVLPCMGFPPTFGSVAKRGFGDVWWGEEAAAHRERMRRPLTTCDSCELVPFCTTRCPRMAAVEDGDLSGPSKRACAIAAVVKGWHSQLHIQD
jgi:radical SAM protein with 4Fe4S-binding SPASM domain